MLQNKHHMFFVAYFIQFTVYIRFTRSLETIVVVTIASCIIITSEMQRRRGSISK